MAQKSKATIKNHQIVLKTVIKTRVFIIFD